MTTLTINEVLHKKLQLVIDCGGIIEYELDPKNFVTGIICYDEDDIVCLRASNRVSEVWVVRLYSTPKIKWKLP